MSRDIDPVCQVMLRPDLSLGASLSALDKGRQWLVCPSLRPRPGGRRPQDAEMACGARDQAGRHVEGVAGRVGQGCPYDTQPQSLASIAAASCCSGIPPRL